MHLSVAKHQTGIECLVGFKEIAHLLCDLAIRDGLTSELNTERVGARHSRCVRDADGSVAIVHNVDVDV